MFHFTFQNLDIAHKLDNASSPKDEYGKHLHPFYELILFLHGDVDYHVEEISKHLITGDIILMTPGEYHYASVDKDVMYERYVLKFPVEIVPEHIRNILKEKDPFFIGSNRVKNLIMSLDRDFSIFSPADFYVIACAKIAEILVYLANYDKKAGGEVTRDFVANIIDYIQVNIKEDLNMDRLSKDLHYSKSYIANEFRMTMKVPIMKYIRSKKIILAQSMILQGIKPSKVAEELHFEDYSTFYRRYLQETGETPSGVKQK